MIESLQIKTPGVDGLRLFGTVLAGDLNFALNEQRTAANGLLVVIEEHFDGYWAEVLRGLADWQTGGAGVPYRRFAVAVNDSLRAVAEGDLANSLETQARVFRLGNEEAAVRWLTEDPEARAGATENKVEGNPPPRLQALAAE